ncbi:MAG: glycosyltransferase family 2 protein [Caldilineaceae bacterium]|nr:glycosyltransferase family 2 protein [Caldilineaceae bacterium]
MDVDVIIPALNEAGNIPQLVREAAAQPVARVIVADNGSTDGTGPLAAEAGAHVVVEPRRGYGYACAAGVAAATGDILLFLDGDFSSLPAEMPRLFLPVQQGRADLVLGSRVLGDILPGAMPPHQRFGNWLTSALMRRLYRVAVTDLGPYRAIRRDLLQELHMQEMTFGWPTEMMVKCARRGVPILEVPVSFAPRRAGQSKVSGTFRGSVLAAYYILGVTLRYAFSTR